MPSLFFHAHIADRTKIPLPPDGVYCSAADITSCRISSGSFPPEPSGYEYVMVFSSSVLPRNFMPNPPFQRDGFAVPELHRYAPAAFLFLRTSLMLTPRLVASSRTVSVCSVGVLICGVAESAMNALHPRERCGHPLHIMPLVKPCNPKAIISILSVGN